MMIEFKNKIESDFKGWGQALNVGEFSDVVKHKLMTEGFSRENSRLVFSVCSDDCNRLEERENIEKSLTKLFGREFHLGGLAGFPVAGVSGIIAASHHVPEIICVESKQLRKGNLVFFVSAHLGLLKMDDFYYGRMIRPGQQSPTACCGAIMGFLSELKQVETLDQFSIMPDNNLDPTKIILYNALIKGHAQQLNNIIAEENVNSQIIKLMMLNQELISNEIQKMIDEFLKREKESFQGKIGFISGITVNSSSRDFFILKEIKIINK